MTGLTQIAITARKSIRYSIYTIIFILVGKFVLDTSISIYKKVFPAPPPAPTVKFGKLTAIPFPANAPTAKFTFSLETTTGGLPTDIPKQAKVFFMPKINPNLLSLDMAKEKAKSLGFTNDPQQKSESLYSFAGPNFPSVLLMNIITGTFSISYDLNADRTPLEAKPPVAEVAASNFRSLLSSANVMPADLTGPTTHFFYKLSDGKLISAISLSEADVVKVNLFRKSYDNLPSVTASPDEANVWAIISGAQDKVQQIIAAEYHYYPVDETQSSTYPIKTPTEAFTELQSGKAFISTLGKYKDGDSIKIRKVYLAYFDPGVSGDYFQPVYVFDSNETTPGDSFVAYVPAVTPDYYGN